MISETALGRLYIGYSNRLTTDIVVNATSDDISLPRRTKVMKLRVKIIGVMSQNMQARPTKFNPLLMDSFIYLSLLSSTFL